MKKQLLILPILIYLLTNCVKDKVEHPFAGKYDCQVYSNSYSNNGESSSSTEQKIIDILLVEDSLDVLGSMLHVENVEYGKSISESYGFSYINYRFEQDSIYITLHYGSSGTNSTTYYAGRKLD